MKGLVNTMLVLFASTSVSAAELTGGQLYLACLACHEIEAGAPHKVGPNLHGIVGKQAGTLEGFAYSPALVKAGEEIALTWQRGTLIGWIVQAERMVPGTWMLYNNTLDVQEVQRLVDYIIEKSSE